MLASLRQKIDDLLCALRQCEAEQDRQFRLTLDEQSLFGLRIIGACMAGGELLYLFSTVVAQRYPGDWPSVLLDGLVLVSGIIIFLLSFIPSVKPHARTIGLFAGYGSILALMWAVFLLLPTHPEYVFAIAAQVGLVLMVLIAAMPVHALQILQLGAAILATYLVSDQIAYRVGLMPDEKLQTVAAVFILSLGVIATGITVVLYEQRYRGFRSHQSQLAAAERMRRVESRALLSENAAVMGRFAAAMSHELNSPVGALKSAIDTLELLANRRNSLPVEKQARSQKIEKDLLASARASAGRLQEIVGRMQRSVNLDRAEQQQVNVNSLLKDVVYMVESQVKGKVQLEFDLGEVPEITVRPQQISAVFSHLLHNAIDGTNGDGTNGDGKVTLSSRRRDHHIEVCVSDNGRGIPAEEVPAIFDPDFRIADDRIRSANWSLFGSRQIVREHGGDIQIQSQPGVGTRVTVQLPA